MSKFILLVEDSPDDVFLTREAFAQIGCPYAIAEAHDGGEALAFLFDEAGRNPKPALIILDLKMPKVGGLEVLRRVRADASLKGVKAVVLSSSNDEREKTEALASGADLFVSKAANYEDFLSIARRICGLLE